MPMKPTKAMLMKGEKPSIAPKPKPERVELPPTVKQTLTRAKNKRKDELAVIKKTTKPTKANLKAAGNIRILKKDAKLKDTFMEVFRDLQHTDKFNLKVFAMKNPKEFYMICAKLIPQEITGANGGPIQVASIVFQ